MKEQWKKLDSDAKLLLNVEEGRSLPIKIELPLSAFSQDKDDCCKKLLVTLRIFVLLALLVLLSWTAMIVYTNYRVKSSVVIKDEEIPTYISEANKIAFKSKVWEDDIKNAVTNDVPVTDRAQEENSGSFKPEYISTAYGFGPPEVGSKKIDSFLKSEVESAESEKVLVNELLQDWHDLFEKIEKEDVPEKIAQVEIKLTETQDKKNEKEDLSHLSFLDPSVGPMFMNQLGQDSQESDEETQKEENVKEDFKLIPIQKWLNILGIEHTITDGDGNNEMQTNIHEFFEDSEEAMKEDIDKIFMQMAKGNQNTLDQFLKAIVDTFGNVEDDLIAEQVSVESNEQTTQSDEGISKNSQASSENKNLVDSKEKPENNDQRPTSEETNEDHSNEEKFLIGFSNLKIFENPTVVPVAEESANQSSEELNKMDEEDTQSTEVPFRGVIQKDIYLLMARRIEAMLGEYDDLLIWYFKNRNEPEPLTDDSQLKYFTARLLFNKDITEFRKYCIFVVSFLMNDDYTRDFSRLVDQSQPKMQAESKTQVQIVNRLVTKSYMGDLYKQGDENTDEIADSIESINLLELRLSGIDVDTFLNSLEENKGIEEPAKEENSSEEIINDDEKRHQAIIEAMRRVGHFEEIYSQEFHIDDSNESKKDDSREFEENISTTSFAEVPVHELSEEIDHRRQAFIQAMQRISDISESKNMSEETDNNVQLIMEDEEESSPETISKESEEITSWKEEPIVEEEKLESNETSVKEYSEETVSQQQAFIQGLKHLTGITEADKSNEENEKNSDQSMKEVEKESSPETISKESEENISWKPVSFLHSVSEEEPIVEEVKSDEKFDVDMIDDELMKRLHSLNEDVLNSKDESKELVDMNDFFTIYDGFDY